MSDLKSGIMTDIISMVEDLSAENWEELDVESLAYGGKKKINFSVEISNQSGIYSIKTEISVPKTHKDERTTTRQSSTDPLYGDGQAL
jgi:hypothetical protein